MQECASKHVLAALLTAPAPGAIAVIGLVGPDCERILYAVARRRGRDDSPKFLPQKPTLCRLVDGIDTIDDAIVVLMQGGARAEINTHGGVRVAQRAVLALARQGATIIDADAFIEQVEPDDPILADVDRAVRSAVSRKLTRWLLAQRDLLPPWLERLPRASDADRDAYELRTRAAIRLAQGITIALVGPPNAGKSTLANRLIGHQRVITSDRPGTTRDWVAETAVISGWPVTLTDTAGIRDATCSIETEAIRRGREQARQADLVVIVLDSTTPAEEQGTAWHRVADFLPAETPRLIAMNKCDSPAARPASGEVTDACMISALHGTGIEELERRIESALGLHQLRDDLPTGFLPDHLRG